MIGQRKNCQFQYDYVVMVVITENLIILISDQISLMTLNKLSSDQAKEKLPGSLLMYSDQGDV